jgi:Arc/MetJ-type ribon-helix-helix transcriptional regulator
MAKCSVRTTLALPVDLLHAIDQAVQEGQARNRSEFIVASVRHELAARERAAIDAAFAAMADDPVYQAEAKAIAAEFEVADWEALRQVAPEP